MNFMHVVGARPNFMKVAAVYRAIQDARHEQSVIHTGQHYDTQMSEVFFRQLEMGPPTRNLEVGSGSHAQQTALIMSRFEPVLLELRPDWVIVYGDVNSTVAAALVCSKLGVRICHVEAGLRSYDRTMPEEVNRVVTDQLADLLFTPSREADENLVREGIPRDKIFFVGNVMIDTLLRALPAADDVYITLSKMLDLSSFGLITLHRPSNVDDESVFLRILDALKALSHSLPLVFPVHPRTRQRWSKELEGIPGLKIIDPLGYLEFIALERNAQVVITDSGGVQEETTALNVPCITIRENTERPITISQGTNVLVGHDTERLKAEFKRVITGKRGAKVIPENWDGSAGRRIASILSMTVGSS